MSLERCPACRARLAPAATACTRCGCDLTLVRQVEQHAQAALRRALRAWAAGDLAQAHAQVEAAARLHATPLVQAMRSALARLRHSGIADGASPTATAGTPAEAEAAEPMWPRRFA